MQLPSRLQTSSVNWLAVSTSYNTLIAAELEQNPEAPQPNLESILEGSDIDTQPSFDKIAAYIERLDATHATSPLGHAFFNGKHLDMGDVCSFFYFLSSKLIAVVSQELNQTTSNRTQPANVFSARESKTSFLLKSLYLKILSLKGV